MKPVRKNDTVKVITGKNKGKTGTVIALLSKKKKLLVKGVNVVTCHTKPRRQGETGGIKKKEAPIALSNVMPVCASCSAPCRIGVRMLENGRRARVCGRCKEVF